MHRLIFVVSFVTLAWAGALAQSTTEQSQNPQQGRDIQFSADQVDYDEQAQRIRLIGDVVIISDGVTLEAPYAEYNTEKESADFQGGVKLVGESTTATGREMQVYYPETRAVLKGAVRIVTEQGMGADQGEPTVILTERLEYDWEKEEGVATGGVKMRQGLRRAFSDRAEIYQQKNEVWLIGNVRIEQPDGDWLTAQRAVYDTETQNVRADGRVVARTRLQSEPETEESSEGPSTASSELPPPMLAPPAYRMLPMRELPVLPLPWLDQRSKVQP